MSYNHAYNLACKLRSFPGHMNKGLRLMQRRLRNVDCIIEVHDARAPFSGRNPEFREIFCGSASTGLIKPHILVLNKKDLTERREQRQVLEELRAREGLQHVLFTNGQDRKCEGVKQILPMANELIAAKERRTGQRAREYSVMMLGVPNVGKSTLLKRLATMKPNNKNTAAVCYYEGPKSRVPGCIKVGDAPSVYMYDTPGIMEPCISNRDTCMKMALLGCVSNPAALNEEKIAGYLLDWLNMNRRYKYVQKLGLDRPIDCIMELLIGVASRNRIQRKMKKIDGHVLVIPDTLLAARHFIKLFRSGQLGSINLDKASRGAELKSCIASC